MSELSIDRGVLDAFVDLAGPALWQARFEDIRRQAAIGPRAGKAIHARHAACYAIERLRRGVPRPSRMERRAGTLAAEAVRRASELSPKGRSRLVETLRASLTDDRTIIPLLHLLRTASLQRARGFAVRFVGLEGESAADLLISRDGAEAEIACEVVSAEEGRRVPRGAWFDLADRVDPDLQRWLETHPGRYVLRVTLPEGLADDGLAGLHARIREMLSAERRAEHDEAAVLRLDRLLLAGAQADELGLLSSLRREFGPEAQVAVTTAGGGILALAARAGRENDVAHAVCGHLDAIAASRLRQGRAGIVALFVEDTDLAEWRELRERPELEGETRQFLLRPQSRPVVAVTFASRIEMFSGEDEVADADLRFRNPAHPAARAPALGPAIASSV